MFLHIRPESERKLYSTNAIKNISKSQLDLTWTDTEHSTSHSPFIFVIYNCSLIFGNVYWMLTFDGLIVIVQIYLFVRSLWLQFFSAFKQPLKNILWRSFILFITPYSYTFFLRSKICSKFTWTQAATFQKRSLTFCTSDKNQHKFLC